MPRLNGPAILADPDAVAVDTENTTTDNGRLIEVAAVDATGKVLLDTLVRPGGEAVHPEATAVHGITNVDLVAEPCMVDLIDHVTTTLRDKHICAWNAGYDAAVLHNECQLLISEHQYAVHTPWLERPWADDMKWHAQWAGDLTASSAATDSTASTAATALPRTAERPGTESGSSRRAPTTQDRPDLLQLRSWRPNSLHPRFGNLEDYQGVEAVVEINHGFGYQLVKLIGSKDTKRTGAFFLARKGSIITIPASLSSINLSPGRRTSPPGPRGCRQECAGRGPDTTRVGVGQFSSNPRVHPHPRSQRRRTHGFRTRKLQLGRTHGRDSHLVASFVFGLAECAVSDLEEVFEGGDPWLRVERGTD